MTKKAAFVVILLLACVLAGATTTVPALQWRWAALKWKLAGEIPEIPLVDFIRWLRPRSPVNLYRLAEGPNVHAKVISEVHSEEAVSRGRALFSKQCATCHGPSARGGAGPNLLTMLGNGGTDWAFFEAVRWGRPRTPMTAQPLSEEEVWYVHAFVRALSQEAAGLPEIDHLTERAISVPFEAIRDARTRPENWLTYAGSYAGHRHTTLASITKSNAAKVQIAWVAQLRSADAFLEASPIVHGDRIYVTESPDGVVALDAGTGRVLWRFLRPVPAGLSLCCGSPNRGVAILGDKLFVQTLDAHLIALDAATGSKRWDVEVADHRDGYSMTGAPLAVQDMLIAGVAGGSFGARGFIAAFRAGDGERLWTFNTVPGPGESGHETWSGNSWRTGGAGAWATGAFEPATGTLYWGVGNASPVYGERSGDSLYSSSVVALEARTGKLKWHYQFTPADERDWDAVQQPVIADIPVDGKVVPALLWANRNGFYYVLDRHSGKFILAKAFVKQTWNRGFDARGRPLLREEARPSHAGALVWPWVGGGTNWWPPSFDPERLLLFVPTVDAAGIYFREEAHFKRGQPFLGGSSQVSANHPVTVAIKAIHASTGIPRWETVLARGTTDVHVSVGGVLSTDSGLVFAGYRDEFLVLDADTGKILRRIRVGGIINAAPISYEIGGLQYVAVMAGKALFTFAVPK